jgi:hypothetical protein
MTIKYFLTGRKNIEENVEEQSKENFLHKESEPRMKIASHIFTRSSPLALLL